MVVNTLTALPQPFKENYAMSTKFEQLLDYLVNEEMDKANELFHEIVVEKSREIYENLIAEEEDQEESVEEADDQEDESVEEADEQEDESVEEAEDQEESVEEESMDLEDSYNLEGDEPGGDATDNLLSKVSADDEEGDAEPEMGPEMGDEDGSEDEAILDIKNAIEELEAAFAQLQQAQGGMDSEMPGDEGPEMEPSDDEEDKPEEMMGMGKHMYENKKRVTREYVEKVGSDWEKGSTQKAQGQYAGAGTGDKEGAPVEGKSPISSGKGKPTTGATAANILGDKKTGHGTNTGTSPAKPDMGVVKSGGKFTGGGTHNVDGVKSGVKTLSKVPAGHGPEKKGAGPGPVGSGSGDKAGQTSIAPETKKQFLPPHTK